ncbi:MAG: valine--tRNA ligase [Bacteroidales bacterium]|jgi:valyl-tRNA synthetase|nr:valine--tRNA ligase [Bacteroidales bacterium]
MNPISEKFNAEDIEKKWYDIWMDNDLFHSEPDSREPYTIVIPPPNVTGILHMGHMLNNTIQDVLIRRARMEGKNACWVPGTDHASIATEAKVVAKLKEEGINKSDLTREEFLSHAWQWKEKHGGIILEQLKKLGASCDWKRTRFTMEEALYESVIDVFVDLYNKGLIYRGVRMVNWDPKALTALSDEEVIFKEQNSKLYYLKYKIENSEQFICVATTRPETIMGDTALCVNPTDERYTHLKEKRVIVPIVGRVIPIIFDEYVDKEFGTGALKITPSHDINDYNIGLKHKLDSINIFNDDGTLNQNGLQYEGLDRFVCRKIIAKDLENAGLMVKTEDYINKVGFSERTLVAIEPKLSLQWFLNMKDISTKALDVVEKDIIKFHPPKFKNTYRHWMENIKDWCISRQLWWGQRIPAYYLPNKEVVVARNEKEALEIANRKFPEENYTINDLKQDEDVLDTWFSSWLWPISVFDGIRYPNNEEINYYYPTNDLITAPEILFFWVARMIIAGEIYRNDIPFRNVYLTGIVRDKQGRKMSKQLGNSPDPIKLIEQYGADGVRVGMLMSSPAGNDLLFDEAYCQQGRNFSNKIWNALRLVKGFVVEDIPQEKSSDIAVKWINTKINQAILSIDEDFSKYRLSESLITTYKLIWDDFCSWYLEIIKPKYQQPIGRKTYNETLDIFEKIIKILHPYMPFISEEIYHLLKERANDDFIMISPRVKYREMDEKILEDFSLMEEIVSAIRLFRNEKAIPLKNKIEVLIKNNEVFNKDLSDIIIKLCNAEKISFIDTAPSRTIPIMVRTLEMYIPLNIAINKEEEIKKLEEDLKYYEGFLTTITKKLSNEKFVSSAPKNIVDNERKKLSDTNEKISSIKEQLSILK